MIRIYHARREIYSTCARQVETELIDFVYLLNPHCTESGTEYAAAHVVGVAALLMWHFPECSNNQIRNAMLRSAHNTRSTDRWDEYYGRGIVNAAAALELLEREGCVDAGGTDPDAEEAPSDLAVGGQWQGCGAEGVAKCDLNNDIFLPCCENDNVACAMLTGRTQGWCGCAPEGELCSPTGGPRGGGGGVEGGYGSGCKRIK